jgi:hypothetical protein
MLRVPRVARGREALRFRGHRRAEFRHVGPAKRDEAGRAEVFRQEGREREGHVAHGPDAERRRLAGERAAQVLEQDRHAAERAVGQVARRLPPRLVEPGADHGVQLGIDLLDPGDGVLGQLRGAGLTAAD